MDEDTPRSVPRRQVIRLSLLALTGLLFAACAPQPPPAPGSWQEEYLRRKQKYREWGQGTSNKN